MGITERKAITKPDYDFIMNFTNWPGVQELNNMLSVYGVDTLDLKNFKHYLETKLSDLLLRGENVITHSSVPVYLDDICKSLEICNEVWRVIAVSSMSTTAGGSLRASVAIVLARRKGQDVANVIYKATYDIKAKDTHIWHNGVDHLEKSKNWLEKSKNWALHKALIDFSRNSDMLLAYLREDWSASISHKQTSFHDITKSF